MLYWSNPSRKIALARAESSARAGAGAPHTAKAKSPAKTIRTIVNAGFRSDHERNAGTLIQ
jgi:hypothetical protein